jgi:hypothetical protein
LPGAEFEKVESIDRIALNFTVDVAITAVGNLQQASSSWWQHSVAAYQAVKSRQQAEIKQADWEILYQR